MSNDNATQVPYTYGTADSVAFEQRHSACYTTRYGSSCTTVTCRRVTRVTPQAGVDEAQVSITIDNWKGEAERHSVDGGHLTLSPAQARRFAYALAPDFFRMVAELAADCAATGYVPPALRQVQAMLEEVQSTPNPERH